jgi:hypothetical protein
MSMTWQILYHGNCFDGVMSSAIFTRLIRDRLAPDAAIHYRAMMHSKDDPYGANHEVTFWADENAVLDFRYSPSPRLTWFCDHHQTTFLDPAHQTHFLADQSGQKYFDPHAPSCAKLLAAWLKQKHGLAGHLFVEHAHWADLIDSANFTSPRQAVELREPALQLMALLESAPGEELINQLIDLLARSTIEEAHALPQIQARLRPVLQTHHRSVDLFRARLQVQNQVAFFDLSNDQVEGFNKFIPYYLSEQIAYTVGLTLSPTRAKVSVGSNPWQRPQPLVNLAELCQKYGGGGHAVVGAITLPPSEIAMARQAAQEITDLLRQSLP